VSARGRFLLPTEFEDVKVRLCNSEGKYLVSDPSGWTFSTDCAKAFVFDFVADDIEQYLELLARSQGLKLKATPVPSVELLELCDQCHRMLPASSAFFDGSHFLCPKCRRKTARRHVVT